MNIQGAGQHLHGWASLITEPEKARLSPPGDGSAWLIMDTMMMEEDLS